MHFDLEEEHKAAYTKEQCEQINYLTDVFDCLLDYEWDITPYYGTIVDVFYYDKGTPDECLNDTIQAYFRKYKLNKKYMDYVNRLIAKGGFQSKFERSGSFSELFMKTEGTNEKEDPAKIRRLKKQIVRLIEEKLGKTEGKLYCVTKWSRVAEEVYFLILSMHYFVYDKYIFLFIFGTSE